MGQFLNKLRSSVRTLLPVLLMVLFATPAMAQSKITVTGTITDATNKQPLIGASVSVEGTTIGVSTDLNGKFTLQVPPTGVLEIQYLGYATKKEKINSRTTINITLSPDNVKVEEVVVIGYGSVAKSDLTGSVTNVKMAEIADAPVTSIDQALQGRVAGADIMSTTGEPGATTSIRIRGTRSITASNEPLIVVDGVMDGVSDLGDINPADIKSISVLKDASSTAIYGARGA
ncbi:MAG: TonB-dependent receptor plug domain-containing protein, partial [Alistipes sp.]|nr:TonB-dependent receptor plug domain-containing protein [Alistipes sp.]